MVASVALPARPYRVPWLVIPPCDQRRTRSVGDTLRVRCASGDYADAMSLRTICLGCGDVTGDARAGRCPRCAAEYEARRRAKRDHTRTVNRSAKGKANRDAHQAIINSPRWRRVAQQVKRRDGFACVACGDTHGLTVHHTEPARFAENPYDADACVTLCRRCHGKAEARVRRLRASQGMSGRGGGSNMQGGGCPQGDAGADARRGFITGFDDTNWIS